MQLKDPVFCLVLTLPILLQFFLAGAAHFRYCKGVANIPLTFVNKARCCAASWELWDHVLQAVGPAVILCCPQEQVGALVVETSTPLFWKISL